MSAIFAAVSKKAFRLPQPSSDRSLGRLFARSFQAKDGRHVR